jgi:hypothetical protein
MDLSTLRQEVKDRGFNYVSDSRIDRWVNLAVNEILEQADWPFLVTTAIGTAPVTITDLRTVESVEDTTNGRKLVPRDRRELSDQYIDLTEAGTPEYYFLSDHDTIDTYPRGGVLRVRYWATQTDLAAGTDTPSIPARYHYAIVDYAVARGYADNDEPDRAQAARMEGDRVLAMMTASLLHGQHDRPTRMTSVGWHGDE